jgi:hypothetical protein
VKPHTSGAVFRYSTTETRSFLNVPPDQQEIPI